MEIQKADLWIPSVYLYTIVGRQVYELLCLLYFILLSSAHRTAVKKVLTTCPLRLMYERERIRV